MLEIEYRWCQVPLPLVEYGCKVRPWFGCKAGDVVIPTCTINVNLRSTGCCCTYSSIKKKNGPVHKDVPRTCVMKINPKSILLYITCCCLVRYYNSLTKLPNMIRIIQSSSVQVRSIHLKEKVYRSRFIRLISSQLSSHA